MAILLKNLSTPVLHLILDKQTALKKEKNRNISKEKTIEILLRDAYLKKENDEEARLERQ